MTENVKFTIRISVETDKEIKAAKKFSEGVDQAIQFIEDYSAMRADAEYQLYMIDVLFNDGSNVKGEFKDAGLAIGFLNKMKMI